MKIGEKDYTPFYNNRRIYELEEAFDNTPIGNIMLKAETLTTKQLGILIWHSIKDHMTFDEFTDNMLPSQYPDAAKECGEAMNKAYGDVVKKK